MDVCGAFRLLYFDDQKETLVSHVTFASTLLVARKIGCVLDERKGQSDVIFVERGRWMFASSTKNNIPIVDMILAYLSAGSHDPSHLMMVRGFVVSSVIMWKRVNGVPVPAERSR